jgi:transposase-like protein
MTPKQHKRSKIGGAPEVPGQNRIAIRDRPDRAQIEFELAAGKSVRSIANKFGVHEGALYKYRKKLPPQLKAAYVGHLLAPGVDLEKLKTQESEGLLQSLAQQRARLLIVQDAEMESGNAQAVATIANAVHRNLELVGRYLGELQQHHTHTHISVLITKEYLELRTALLRALAPFPDARRAVADTLHRIEDGVAHRPQPAMIDITPTATALPA